MQRFTSLSLYVCNFLDQRKNVAYLWSTSWYFHVCIHWIIIKSVAFILITLSDWFCALKNYIFTLLPSYIKYFPQMQILWHKCNMRWEQKQSITIYEYGNVIMESIPLCANKSLLRSSYLKVFEICNTPWIAVFNLLYNRISKITLYNFWSKTFFHFHINPSFLTLPSSHYPCLSPFLFPIPGASEASHKGSTKSVT